MLNEKFDNQYKREVEQIEVNQDLKQKIASQLKIEPEKPMEKKTPLFVLFSPLLGVTAVALVLFFVVSPDAIENMTDPIVYGDQIDDWVFDGVDEEEVLSKSYGSTTGLGSSGFGSLSALGSSPSVISDMAMEESIGFSVGGSKDVDSFRTNIENGYLPLIDSLTYEGLFYEYFFDTGAEEVCADLFCPSYTKAVSLDPLSGEEEFYLAVGLNSGMTEADFERKKLNLVVVMDISGSMNSSFDQYYYDGYGNYMEVEEYSSDSKMEVANESVVGLLSHLNNDDRIGIVLFDDEAYEAKPVRLVGETDMNALEEHILDITPQGGTDMSEGMDMATKLLSEFEGVDADEYENRIIFITDAMPNTGDISKGGLLGMVEDNADKGVYTTFIGVGVDFQSELIESITNVRGANYYSVHSSKEFSERMDEGFEYMVTPLVFNLELVLEAEGYDIEAVYGSPEANLATGEILYVNTLFPSKTTGGETRGGLILLKLTKTSENAEMSLSAQYEDRTGTVFSTDEEITFEHTQAGSYDTTGIRKGILLSRYVDVLKNWMIDERGAMVYARDIEVSLNDEVGITAPDSIPTGSLWEQTSVPLTVAQAYQELFVQFLEHFKSEMKELDDAELEQEIEILETLVGAPRGLLEGFMEDFF